MLFCCLFFYFILKSHISFVCVRVPFVSHVFHYDIWWSSNSVIVTSLRSPPAPLSPSLFLALSMCVVWSILSNSTVYMRWSHTYAGYIDKRVNDVFSEHFYGYSVGCVYFGSTPFFPCSWLFEHMCVHLEVYIHFVSNCLLSLPSLLLFIL